MGAVGEVADAGNRPGGVSRPRPPATLSETAPGALVLAAAGLVIATCLAIATCLGIAPVPAVAQPVYKKTSFSFAERAADLVSRMTLDEKAAQLSSTNAPAIDRLGVQSYSYWNESQHGIYFLQANDPVRRQPTWFNRITAPSFPTNLAASLSWSPRLIHRTADAISDEVRGFNDPARFGELPNNLGESPRNYGSLFHFNPTVNLQRDPRWGRTDEAFGEDPFLVSRLAGAYVRGFQGQDLSGRPENRYLKAVATLKHYALNNVEQDRTSISSDTDEAMIRDYYTAQFRSLIEDAGAVGLMSAYNAVNGTPAVADTFLLNVLARRTWGFDGYVTSDCGAVATTYRRPDVIIGPGIPIRFTGHDWAPPGWSTDGGGVGSIWSGPSGDLTISGRAGGQAWALRAGTDINCAGAGTDNATLRDWFGQENRVELIREAIEAGVLSEGVIDRALLRTFTLRMRTGEFDPPARVPYTRILSDVIDSEAHRKLTGEVARKSIVLLRNRAEGTTARPVLPADPSATDRVVVLGNLADEIVLGGYSGFPTESITPLEGIEALLAERNPGAEVIFDDAGTSTTATDPAVLDPATVAALPSADLVVVVAGTDAASNSEGADRPDLEMPGNYDSLISKVLQSGNENVVLAVQAAGPVSLEAAGSVPAILYTAPNGQRQGQALADTIFGLSKPSGRLSFTWYRDDSQLPPMDDYDLTPEDTGGLGRTYRYFTGDPEFEFGYGLSYTSFSYEQPRVSETRIRAGGTLPVSVRVRNTGDVTSSTVIQVYATAAGRAGGRELPDRRLIAFARTGPIEPGEARELSWRIPVERLRLYDTRLGRDVVYRHSYGIEISRWAGSPIATRRVQVVDGNLPRTVRHVTLQPEDLVLRKGAQVNLLGRNRWLADSTAGRYPEMADGILEAARSDQSLVDVQRAGVTFRSNRPSVVRVDSRGRLRAIAPGVATVTATIDKASGRTVVVVR
jgi:beta-glucosidase-like glycosyl hydrolase